MASLISYVASRVEKKKREKGHLLEIYTQPAVKIMEERALDRRKKRRHDKVIVSRKGSSVKRSPPLRACPRLLLRHSKSTSSHSLMNLTWHSKPQIVFVDFYHWCLDLTWWKLFLGLSLFYALVNVAFGFLFWLSGPGTLAGAIDSSRHHPIDCFFFSAQTISTVGFGHIYPATWYTSLLVMVESWLGVFITAFIIVVIHGKFTRPSRAKRMIIFTDKACLMFREDDDSNESETRSGHWYLVLRFVNVRKAQLCNTQFHLVMLEWQHYDEDDSIGSDERSGLTTRSYDGSGSGDHQSGYGTDGYTVLGRIRSEVRNAFHRLPEPATENAHMGLTHDDDDDGDDDSTERYDDVIETGLVDARLGRRGSIVPRMRQFTRNVLKQRRRSIDHESGRIKVKEYIVPKIHELDFELNTQLGQAKKLSISSPMLPLPWVCAHKVDCHSPLFPHVKTTLQQLKQHAQLLGAQDVDWSLRAQNIEIIAVLDGCDEATSDSLQAKFSYMPSDIMVNHEFVPDMCLEDGRFAVDYARFHKMRPVDQPVFDMSPSSL